MAVVVELICCDVWKGLVLKHWRWWYKIYPRNYFLYYFHLCYNFNFNVSLRYTSSTISVFFSFLFLFLFLFFILRFLSSFFFSFSFSSSICWADTKDARTQVQATNNYKAADTDELSLEAGDVIYVLPIENIDLEVNG